MRRLAACALFALALHVPAAAAPPDFQGMQAEPYQPRKPAPAFTLPSLDGRTVRLDELRGKVVLLFFWATWWPDCRKELPSVNQLYTEFKAKGFEVLLVNFRESVDTVRKAAQDRGYVAPVLLDASGDVTGRVYGVWGPPTVYFVDRQGQLIARIQGARDWSTPAARNLIQSLLEEPPLK